MRSSVPVPTDNIYKFYSLFGLLIMLSSIFAFVSVYNKYTDRAFDRYVELEVLNSLKQLDPKQIATKAALEKQREIDKDNKKFFQIILGYFMGISIVLMSIGFYRWHSKIQPRQDQLLDRQISKLDLEIKLLQKQIREPLLRRSRN